MAWVGLAPGVAFVAGAAGGVVLDVPLPAWRVVLPWLALAAAVLWWRRRARMSLAAAVAAFALCGACLSAHARDEALRSPLRALLEREYPGFALDTLGPPPPHGPITIRAALTEDAAVTSDFTTLRVRARAVCLRGRWHAVDEGLTVTVGGGAERRRGDEWVAGRTIEMPVAFRRPARYLNEGVPDFERDLALDGTALFASVKSGLLIDVLQRGNVIAEAAARVRRYVREVVLEWVGRRDRLAAAIVTAVLIGDRTGLPDDVRQRLQAAGTYHVIAISGGNIAILAALCLGLLRLTGAAGRLAALGTLLVLIGYALLVTAGPSVWRATLMAALYLIARLLDHRSPPWHALIVTAMVVVCVRPLDVRDVGFLLTFGATAALLDVARRVQAWPRRSRVAAWTLASLLASLAAEAALLPVTAHAFSRVTSAGLILNLLAVPLMAVVQVAGLVVVAFSTLDMLAASAGWIACAAARGLVESARLVEVVPWLSARVPPPPVAVITIYYVALAGVLVGRGRVRLGCMVALALAATTIATGIAWPPRAPSPLRLTVFDVGQGDAMLLESGDRTLLVDAGGTPFGGIFDIGGRVLAPALWTRGLRRLDAMLATHGDPDHIGGARSIVADFEPAALWEGVPVVAHRGLQALLADARDRGVALERRVAGESFAFGAAQVRVLHPPLPDWERPRVRNDDSVVLEVVLRDVAILLTGDISATVERAILPRLTPARTRILKVAHHGSRTSSSRALLEGWRPQIAIVSAGRGNTFGHPAPEVLRRLQSMGATVYRTDRHGQITLDTDGKVVSVGTFMATEFWPRRARRSLRVLATESTEITEGSGHGEHGDH